VRPADSEVLGTCLTATIESKTSPQNREAGKWEKLDTVFAGTPTQEKKEKNKKETRRDKTNQIFKAH